MLYFCCCGLLSSGQWGALTVSSELPAVQINHYKKWENNNHLLWFTAKERTPKSSLLFPGCKAVSLFQPRQLVFRRSEIKDVPQDKADPVREGLVPPSVLWPLFSLVLLVHPVSTTGRCQEQGEETPLLHVSQHLQSCSPHPVRALALV